MLTYSQLLVIEITHFHNHVNLLTIQLNLKKCSFYQCEMSLGVALFASLSSLASLSLCLLAIQVDSSVNCQFFFYKVFFFLLIFRSSLYVLHTLLSFICVANISTQETFIYCSYGTFILRTFKLSIFPICFKFQFFFFFLKNPSIFANNTV